MAFKTNVVLWTYLLTVGSANGSLAETKAESARDTKEHVLCKGYLDMKGSILEPQSKVSDLARPFFSALRDTLPRPPIRSWPSNSIDPQKLVDVKRLVEIVAQARDPKSQLNADLTNHVQELGGMESPVMWDTYLKSYDKIATFSSDLHNIANAAHDILPKDGVIFDVGAGTATISAILLLLAPERKVVAGDWSTTGLALAKTKLDLVTNREPGRYKLLNMDLTKEEDWPTQKFDGAVMNNVLYAFGDHKVKLEVLKRICDSLKPGAPFILSDILNLSFPELQVALAGTAANGVRGGGPVTEYDIALAAKVNYDVLIKFSHLFTSPEELRKLAREAGFQVNGWYTAYNGAATFFYLTKPNKE